MHRALFYASSTFVAAVALFGAATELEAKKQPKTKAFLEFSWASHPTPGLVTRSSFGITPARLDGAPVFYVGSNTKTKDVATNGFPDLFFRLEAKDWARLAYPAQLPAAEVQWRLNTSGLLYGYFQSIWVQGGSSGFTVTVESYDRKTRLVSGSFSFTGLADATPGDAVALAPESVTGRFALPFPGPDIESVYPTYFTRETSRRPGLLLFKESGLNVDTFAGALRLSSQSFVTYVGTEERLNQWFSADLPAKASKLTYPATYPIQEAGLVYGQFDTDLNGHRTDPVLTGLYFNDDAATNTVTLESYDKKTKLLRGSWTFNAMRSTQARAQFGTLDWKGTFVIKAK